LDSYYLTIYYQNYSFYNSGIVTVLSNRIGDAGLLITIGFIIIYGKWDMYATDMKNSFIYVMILCDYKKGSDTFFYLVVDSYSSSCFSFFTHLQQRFI